MTTFKAFSKILAVFTEVIGVFFRAGFDSSIVLEMSDKLGILVFATSLVAMTTKAEA